MAFDFFVPATERGNQMAQTFVIEDMGYDLYPISWERLSGIASLYEPRMLFAFEKGEVLYARSEEERQRFYDWKEQMHENLKNRELTFQKGLEFLNTAMEIYQTMLFEDSLCKERKAAGGISCYLMNAIAMGNGTYLKNGYQDLIREMERMEQLPEQFREDYEKIFQAKEKEELLHICYCMIKSTRDFFLERKPEEEREEYGINYTDLADWYQEARYTFRRIQYYAKVRDVENSYLLGCYLQIEFDAIQEDFNLQPLDLLGVFDAQNLGKFAQRAQQLEDYITSVLKENHAELKIYDNLETFLEAR